MSMVFYPGIPFSPQAALTANIGAADTVIPVSDVSVFPAAPNLATIGTDEDGETILYAAKTANALSGCQRGIEGTAKTWQAGEVIARNFTAKDHNDLIAALPVVRSLELPAEGWEGEEAPFVQAVAVLGVVADPAAQIIQIQPADRAVWAACGLECTGQGAGTLAFSARDRPMEAVALLVAVQAAKGGTSM